MAYPSEISLETPAPEFAFGIAFFGIRKIPNSESTARPANIPTGLSKAPLRTSLAPPTAAEIASVSCTGTSGPAIEEEILDNIAGNAKYAMPNRTRFIIIRIRDWKHSVRNAFLKLQSSMKRNSSAIIIKNMNTPTSGINKDERNNAFGMNSEVNAEVTGLVRSFESSVLNPIMSVTSPVETFAQISFILNCIILSPSPSGVSSLAAATSSGFWHASFNCSKSTSVDESSGSWLSRVARAIGESPFSIEAESAWMSCGMEKNIAANESARKPIPKRTKEIKPMRKLFMPTMVCDNVASIKNIIKRLKLPSKYSHKGQNGKLLIIGGSRWYHGAPMLAILAARRFVDLVYFYPGEWNEQIVKAVRTIPEVIVLPNLRRIEEMDCVLFGIGLGNALFPAQILQRAKRLVIDGDGLKLIKGRRELAKGAVLTPHEGEFRVLFGISGTKENVKKAAKKYGCVILKKNPHGDIITDGKQIFVNRTHNQGMTKGGTGDVLSGLVAALHCKNPAFESAVAGAYICGAAGNSLKKEFGFNFSASDLASRLAKTVKQLSL